MKGIWSVVCCLSKEDGATEAALQGGFAISSTVEHLAINQKGEVSKASLLHKTQKSASYVGRRMT